MIIININDFIDSKSLVTTVSYDVLKTIFSTSSGYFKIKLEKFFKNLNSKPTTEEELKFLLDGLNYINISSEDLVEYFAHLTNQCFSNKQSDLYRTYYQILSTLTLYDISKLEECLYNKEFYINNLQTPIVDAVSIMNLSRYHLIYGYRYEEDIINGTNPEIDHYSLTDLGEHFLRSCLNKFD